MEVGALRETFLKKYNESIANGAYDQRDIDFVNSSDAYLSCFIHAFGNDKNDLTKPAEYLDTVLTFRKEIGLNDLNADCGPKELIERNVVYWNGVDNENRKILLFKVAGYQKGKYVKETRAYVAWLLEQHHRSNLGGTRIVLIFDFTNAGISNMDLDVTRYIITCLSTYFPCILGYILLYEMPWLLSSIWKVIRGWLTEEQKKKTILVKQTEILSYIPAQELEPHMQPPA
jgi:hypothetical protein